MAESTEERIRREQREKIARMNAASAKEDAFKKDEEALKRAAAKAAREAAEAAKKAEKLKPVTKFRDYRGSKGQVKDADK